MATIIKVSKKLPCPICGEPDWCYFLNNVFVNQKGTHVVKKKGTTL